MSKGATNGNSSQRSLSLSTHPDYYLRGGDLFFLCERILFRVHSHFFLRESEFWRKELKDDPIKGTSDSTAIVLTHEKPGDFEKLLWVFYNMDYGNYSNATLNNWITILRYSTIWEFPQVKELAIRHLEADRSMNTIQRIKLYQDNRVPETYLLTYYKEVARRPEMLSMDESRLLNLETLVRLYHARERLRSQPPVDRPHLSPIRTDFADLDVDNIVSATFGLPTSSVDPRSAIDPRRSHPNGATANGATANGATPSGVTIVTSNGATANGVAPNGATADGGGSGSGKRTAAKKKGEDKDKDKGASGSVWPF